ncbi:RNA polymerase recycling motor HelD [Metabacillus litoralis]|uniref:RNA polymerase recycling motor HelD n=1 Tax=Metabacillus litoralis TaxID=152268 RepID=UPI001CFECDAA|nr:RNA polymerase recycling motor HelD [Metabacillus litoralis]
MDQFDIDLTEEQDRINDVIVKMKKELSSLQAQTSTMKTDIVSIRKNFWEDVTVNLDDAVEAGETATSIKQQAEFLAEKEHRHKHLDRDYKNLTNLVETPYFARIDFIEDGEEEVESIYLGIASYIDRDSDEFLVYDWRAPISSLYYDYSLGSAQFKAPGGTISGELKLKRQFIIKNGTIKAMFDTGVTIGDELLQEVLGKQSDSQMKSIVATIQQEQNKVIRNEKGKLLIVQGAAGSGKTSAALQRVAYLLYKYRETLEAEEILLFSPNTMFNSYIRNVLPELGEENMQQTTFQNYLQHSLGDKFEVEDLFSQMEYMLTAINDEDLDIRKKASKFKSSFQYMNMIEDYLTYLGKQGLIFKDIFFRQEELFHSKDIYAYFYSLDSTVSITNRIKLVMEWLLSELKEVEKRERAKAWVEEEIQFLSKDEYQFYFEKLSKQKRFTQETFDDYDREHELLSKYVVKRNLVSVKKAIKSYSFIDMAAIYQQLFKLPRELLSDDQILIGEDEWQKICAFSIKEIDYGKLPYEDATPYLYLKEKIEGFKVNTTVRYVFIDEAQDYSAFQFSFIKHLFPNAKMTVLGDINQAIYAHQSYTGLGALTKLFEEDKTEKIELNRSYRSTFEIVKFTSALLEGQGKEIIPFNRNGQKPVVIKSQSEEEMVKSINEKLKSFHDYQSIAIICKTAEESIVVHDLLKEYIDIYLVDKRSNEFDKGVVVIPAYLAKGIEFDAVIIFNASNKRYTDDSVRNLFYTACTRAMHELYVFYEGDLTPFIREISEELYIEE